MWNRRAIIIPGAQKSGTTTLFRMLARHSRVDPSRLKEPQFFALSPEEIAEKFSWYKALFSQDEDKILLEASSFYLSSRAAPAMIKKHLAAPRILIILRDPAQRAYSSHLHMHAKEPPAERRSFGAILDEVTRKAIPGQRGSVRQAEEEALRRAVEQGQVDVGYLDEGYHRRFHREKGAAIRTRVEDPLFLYKYFQQSMYREPVERYMRTFGTENVKILFFEKLIADPGAAMREVLDFLKLRSEPSALALLHRNKTKMPRSKLRKRLLRFRRESAGLDGLIRGLNSIGLAPVVRSIEQYVRKAPPKASLGEVQYKQARSLLADEYAYWCARHGELTRLWKY